MSVERNKVCLGCGNDKDNSIFLAYEKMLGLGVAFKYLNCSACKSIQISDIPENIDEYYPENYYAFGNLIESKGLRNQFKKIRKILFDWKLWHFSYPEYYNWLKPLSILRDSAIADIGCGNGQLLYELSCTGYTNLHGFDPYLKKEMSTHGLNLQRKDVMEVSGQFDLIMLHHSFEHMVNPLESMKRLGQLLKPEGQLLIRVPVTDAEVWEKEGINWFQLDAPRHFFIPSRLAMRILGEKAGLKLNLVVFDSNENQFAITNLYKDGKSMKEYNSKNLEVKKSKKNWKLKADILNKTGKGDQACFYFKNNG